MKDIGGRVAVVTGGSRGIGPYIARTLFDHGMKVVLAARSIDDVEEVRKDFDPRGVRSLAVKSDVTDEADRKGLLGAARKRFGQVDVLVNNAGIEDTEPFVDADFDRVRAIIELNVLSVMRLTQLALPEMLTRGSGHVVNIASLAGLAPVPYNVAYSTSKHAVVGFSESLRYELAESGVGVSVVCPGFIREAGMFADHGPDADAGVAGTSSPQEVADAVHRAITQDRSRVLVTPLLARTTPVLRAIAPGILYRTMRDGGVIKSLRSAAEKTRDERLAAAAPAAAKPARRRKTEAGSTS
jgi:short-subunit dehydrogenase